MICELYGDIPNFTDEYITIEMGDVSFYQMIYWYTATTSALSLVLDCGASQDVHHYKHCGLWRLLSQDSPLTILHHPLHHRRWAVCDPNALSLAPSLQ